MKLLELPLECFRPIIALVANDLDMPRLLELRLVNQTLNTEVLHAIGTVSFLSPAAYRWDSPNYPWCQEAFRKTLPITSRYVDFIASVVFTRPRLQDPWNANISSFLNSVVDELLRADGFGVGDASRKEILHKLCHHLFEMKHWKQQTWWFIEALNQGPEYLHHSETLEFNVLLASIILGKRTTLHDLEVPVLLQKKSPVFGTLVDASVKSEQVDLVKYILDIGVDLNNGFHSALEMAAECPDANMLRTLFAPEYGLACSDERLKNCIMHAIENDRTEAALYLLRKNDDPTLVKKYELDAFREAYMHGNLPIVKAMIEELGIDFDKHVNASDHCALQYAAFYGHKHILQYFFDKGAGREPLTMRSAAISGDIDMARFLHEQGIRSEPGRWAALLGIATDHATPRHFAWTLSVLNESLITPEQLLQAESTMEDLIQSACVYGNVDLVRVLVNAGLDINNIKYLEDTPPVLIAKVAGLPEVADALVEMGASQIDPMETQSAEMFRTGEYPRRWKARRVCERDCLRSYT